MRTRHRAAGEKVRDEMSYSRNPRGVEKLDLHQDAALSLQGGSARRTVESRYCPLVSEDRYTHGHHESVLRSHRWRTAENSAAFLLPHLETDFNLLDVGCGPGNITADLAQLVPGGSVTGIDRSAEVVARAQVEFASHAGGNLRFEQGDVYRLRFPDDQFDVVFAHQVLQHLTRPIEAIREMRRVTKPGGVVAVRDADFGAFVWAPDDPTLDSWMDIYHQLTRRNGAEADAGRKLKGWVHSAGFRDLKVSSSNWTFSTDSERSWWGGLWADRVTESDFARQSIEYGLCGPADLASFAAAFRRWVNEPDGVFIVVNIECLARK